MAAEQTSSSVEQLELRLEEQAAAVSDLSDQLTNERAAAEKRGHDLVEKIGRLMDKIGDIDSRTQGESSGQRPAPTAGGAAGGADASPQSSDPSQEGEGVAAEGGSSVDQPGRRGPTGGLGPIGEQPPSAHSSSQGGVRRGPRTKMAVPTLENPEDFDSFCRRMKVYAKLCGFATNCLHE